jgi:hypothetical protein
MALQLSTGFANALLNTGLNTIWTTPVMEVRDGVQPINADDAPVGNIICTVSLPTSSYWATAAAKAKAKNGTWQGTVSAGGTPTWFRIKNTADTGGSSTTLPRLDGSYGLTDADDIKSDLATYVMGDIIVISQFAVTLSNLFQVRGR